MTTRQEQEQALRELVAAAIRGELNGNELGFLQMLAPLVPSLLPAAGNIANSVTTGVQSAIDKIFPPAKPKQDPLQLIAAFQALQPPPAPKPLPAPVVAPPPAPVPVLKMSAPTAQAGSTESLFKSPMFMIGIAAVALFFLMGNKKKRR